MTLKDCSLAISRSAPVPGRSKVRILPGLDLERMPAGSYRLLRPGTGALRTAPVDCAASTKLGFFACFLRFSRFSATLAARC